MRLILLIIQEEKEVTMLTWYDHKGLYIMKSSVTDLCQLEHAAKRTYTEHEKDDRYLQKCMKYDKFGAKVHMLIHDLESIPTTSELHGYFEFRYLSQTIIGSLETQTSILYNAYSAHIDDLPIVHSAIVHTKPNWTKGT